MITETNKKTTGNYKCEISVEGTFQTVAAEKSMIVMGKFDVIFFHLFIFQSTNQSIERSHHNFFSFVFYIS